MIMLQRFIWNSHKNSYLITNELLILGSHEVRCGCDSSWRIRLCWPWLVVCDPLAVPQPPAHRAGSAGCGRMQHGRREGSCSAPHTACSCKSSPALRFIHGAASQGHQLRDRALKTELWSHRRNGGVRRRWAGEDVVGSSLCLGSPAGGWELKHKPQEIKYGEGALLSSIHVGIISELEWDGGGCV